MKKAKKPTTKKALQKKDVRKKRSFIYKNFSDLVTLALDYNFFISEDFKHEQIKIPTKKNEREIFFSGVVHGIASTLALFEKHLLKDNVLNEELTKELIAEKVTKIKTIKKVKSKTKKS